jgi:hypothetical protein
LVEHLSRRYLDSVLAKRGQHLQALKVECREQRVDAHHLALVYDSSVVTVGQLTLLAPLQHLFWIHQLIGYEALELYRVCTAGLSVAYHLEGSV